MEEVAASSKEERRQNAFMAAMRRVIPGAGKSESDKPTKDEKAALDILATSISQARIRFVIFVIDTPKQLEAARYLAGKMASQNEDVPVEDESRCGAVFRDPTYHAECSAGHSDALVILDASTPPEGVTPQKHLARQVSDMNLHLRRLVCSDHEWLARSKHQLSTLVIDTSLPETMTGVEILMRTAALPERSSPTPRSASPKPMGPVTTNPSTEGFFVPKTLTDPHNIRVLLQRVDIANSSNVAALQSVLLQTIALRGKAEQEAATLARFKAAAGSPKTEHSAPGPHGTLSPESRGGGGARAALPPRLAGRFEFGGSSATDDDVAASVRVSFPHSRSAGSSPAEERRAAPFSEMRRSRPPMAPQSPPKTPVAAAMLVSPTFSRTSRLGDDLPASRAALDQGAAAAPEDLTLTTDARGGVSPALDAAAAAPTAPTAPTAPVAVSPRTQHRIARMLRENPSDLTFDSTSL